MLRKFVCLIMAMLMVLTTLPINLCDIAWAQEISIGELALPETTAGTELPISALGNSATGVVDTPEVVVPETVPSEVEDASSSEEERTIIASGFCGGDATAEYDSGSGCYKNLAWALDSEGVLAITGTGAMTSTPWRVYQSEIWSVVIEDGVTSICDYAFNCCDYLEDATIADSVVDMGVWVFAGCESLTSVKMSANTGRIPHGTFNGCSSLEYISIPERMVAIGEKAFYGCTSLTSISLSAVPPADGEAGVVIGDYAFYGCRALEEVSLTGDFEWIGVYAFGDCSSLQTITLPPTLESVEQYAFRYCSSLTGVYISDMDAWFNCVFNGSYANPLCLAHKLYLNGELVKTAIVPDGTTIIDINALLGADEITTVFIPDSVELIDQYAFYNMSSLTTVYYAGSVSQWNVVLCNAYNQSLWAATIEFNAPISDFEHITVEPGDHGTILLEEDYVRPGETVMAIAFPEAGYQAEYYYLNGQLLEGDSFVAEEDGNTVTATFKKAYDVVDWGDYSKTVRWAISADDILYLYGLDEVVSSTVIAARTGNEMPEKSAVVSSEKSAGAVVASAVSPVFTSWHTYDKIIVSAVVGEGFRSLPSCAFYGCSKLTSVSLPSSLTRIGHMAFANCGCLQSIDIPDSVVYVGEYAFTQCRALTEVDIPDSVTMITYGAFSNCYALQNVEIPNSVTMISYQAFADCIALESVDLPNSLKHIVYRAFSGCSSLESITIPASVDAVESYSFEGCEKLHSADFLGNAPEHFGWNVFDGTASDFIIYYHTNTEGWNTPLFCGYPCACNDPVSDYSTLDDDNRNAQGVTFKLNILSKTAVLGNGSNSYNSCGYYGGQNGAVVIPDTVTKGDTTYRVIGINKYAFACNQWIKTVTLGANISSVAPTAFAGCPNLTAISVDEGNTFFKSYDGVLYDLSGLNLYCYPAGRVAAQYQPLSSCTTIGTMAFYGAWNLTKLTIPATVSVINGNAFSFMPALEEITLPFLGCTAEDECLFSYVFDSGADQSCLDETARAYFGAVSDTGYVPGTLRTVTILQPDLTDDAFADCSTLERIYFPNCAELMEIPQRCFAGCTGLKTLLFGGSKTSDQTGVLISAGVSDVGVTAFVDCIGLEKFAVASGNTAYAVDQYGVLYSSDMTELCCYPAGRPWPYYNVAGTVTTIGYFAFARCPELLNTYIPATVTDMAPNAVWNCGVTTFCVYQDSAAARFLTANKQTVWYMDNCEIQKIELPTLPDQLNFTTGGVEGLHALADYGGVTLDLDDYEIELEKPYGTQTVTVSVGDKSASFETMVVRRGDINGDSTMTQTKSDPTDMQCLYTYLSTLGNEGLIEDSEYFQVVADVNGDGAVNILDYQTLYEMVKP